MNLNAASVCRNVHFSSHQDEWHYVREKHKQEIESKFVFKLSGITRSTPLKRIADLQTQDEKWIKRISVSQMRAHGLGDVHNKQLVEGHTSLLMQKNTVNLQMITDYSYTCPGRLLTFCLHRSQNCISIFSLKAE